MREDIPVLAKHSIPAAAYIRCSTEMQEDSPDQQRKEILTFAALHGYEVIEWFEDFGKSGTTFDQRPEFQRLRRAVEDKPPFRAVICYDESRWGRAIDAEENTFWRVYFRKYGVSVLLVKTSIDPDHEFAPMLKSFESIQASQFSKKLSELTLRGCKNNTKYSNGGTAPYGYERVAVNTKTGAQRILTTGEWCIKGQEKVEWGLGNESEVQIVKRIFQRRSQGWAYLSIASELNRDNVPCPKRGRWRNKDQKWSTVTIKTILDNPTYYGARVYNRNSMSKIVAGQQRRSLRPGVQYPHWRNPQSDWILIDDAHEPIVSRDLWEAANAVKSIPAARAGNGTALTSQFLLTGLLRCSRCTFAFQGWSGRAKGRQYLRYVDGGWKAKRVCSNLSLPKERLETFAVESIRETLAEPYLADRLEETIRRLLNAEPDQEALNEKALRRELVTKRAMIRNLVEEIALGNRTDLLRKRLAELEADESHILFQLQKLGNVSRSAYSVKGMLSEVSQFILNFDREFERTEITEKKMMIRRCIREIIVDRDRSVARYHIRRIPAVSPALEELLQKQKVLTEVVSTQSSGDRT